MKLNTIIAVFVGMLAMPVLADELACRAADEGNANRIDVAVTTVSGSEVVEPTVTPYQGYELTVVYNVGDSFEPQTVLTLSADRFAARSYNVSQDGLYQLLAPGLFLQCWFE